MKEVNSGERGEGPRKETSRRQMSDSGGNKPADGSSQILYCKQRGKTEVSPVDQKPAYERSGTLAERHPDWPKLNVTLVLGRHRTAADGASLRQHVSRADVCFFEDSGGYPMLNEFQEFADMDPTYENTERVKNFIETRVFAGGNGRVKGGYYEAVVRSLFEAPNKVIVGHIDLLHDDPVSGAKITEEFKKPYWEPSFEKTLDNLQDKYKRISEMQEERECIMTRRLETQLEEIFDNNSDLRERPLEIMIALGDRHRSFADKLAGEGVQARKEFTTDEESVSPQDTIQYMLARGEEPSRDLVAKALLGNILDGALNASMETPPDYGEDVRYKRMVSNQFTREEIKVFYESSMAGTGALTLGAVSRFFRKKGIPSLPRTKEKMQAAIESLQQREQGPAQ